MIPPGLERPIEQAALRRERRGAFGDARLTLPALTAAEADALDGLPWHGRRRPFLAGETPTLGLARLEAALEAGGLRPQALYAEALGRPLRDLPAESRARRAAGRRFREAILGHHLLAERPVLREWTERALASGRLRPADADLLDRALTVIARLPPAEPVDRAVLAAELFDGRPHALDADGPLERLVRSLLATCRDGDDGERQRATWGAFGVEIDPTSSVVLTLGLHSCGDQALEVALREQVGCHVVLTLGQLERMTMAWPADDVYVCENPSVLRAAERALGAGCRPLVCAAGWPTDAVRVLLGQLSAAGAVLHYHGDFDPYGVAIFRLLEREVGIVPWRYDEGAYRIALAGLAARDLPVIEAGHRDGALETALAAGGRAIPEELVIPELLSDLRRVQPARADAGRCGRRSPPSRC